MLLAALALINAHGTGTCAARSTAARESSAIQAGLFPRTPEESTAAIATQPGLTVELFAAEPHLASPVAMAFDADGDVYVAEMLDYPIIRTPGMFGPFPEGQVRLLKTDADGRVTKSTVFATGIASPTSVVPYNGGVLVAAAPISFSSRTPTATGTPMYGRSCSRAFPPIQDLYRVNSLFWGNDGWIYARGVDDTPIHWGDDLKGPALSTDGMNFRFQPKAATFRGDIGNVGLLRIDDGRLGSPVFHQFGQARSSGRPP